MLLCRGGFETRHYMYPDPCATSWSASVAPGVLENRLDQAYIKGRTLRINISTIDANHDRIFSPRNHGPR